MFKKCSKFHWCTLGGVNFIKTVYELFDNLSYLCKSSFTMYNIRDLLCTILKMSMMCIFPNCVKNVRVQALSDSVKFSRQLMKIILDLWSFDLTTSKDQRQVNNWLKNWPRYVHVCHYVHVYISPSTLIFENFKGGGGVLDTMQNKLALQTAG